jgi:hypothetical protein
MTCPFCDFIGTRRELHAHLTDSHGEECRTTESWSGRHYLLECPQCGFTIKRQIKPRLQDPTFLEEYAREIRLVAFDMFLYHLEGQHEQEEAGA